MKIKLKPKAKRVNIDKKFGLSVSSQGEVSRGVLYLIKLRKLVRYITDYQERTGLTYEKLCILTSEIERILIRDNVIKVTGDGKKSK